jgi:hypothetical protein
LEKMHGDGEEEMDFENRTKGGSAKYGVTRAGK